MKEVKDKNKKEAEDGQDTFATVNNEKGSDIGTTDSSEITSNDVTVINQIFELAKRGCLDNDNLLMQVLSYKQSFMNKLSAHVATL